MPDRPRGQVLVVEDTPSARRLYQALLAAEGYEVVVAATAEDALETLKTFRPRLILMDIQLPGMDGLSLARKLKADPESRHVQIVAITAFSMTATHAAATAAGCDGYLTKPISLRLLVETVASMLGREEPS